MSPGSAYKPVSTATEASEITDAPAGPSGFAGQHAIEAYFEGKPETHEIFELVYQRVRSQGPFEVSVGSQISFSVNRKFAWFWLYNVTRKNPNGILHTTLCMDKLIDDPHVRAVTQISKNRWNHQVIIRTLSDARSGWIRRLLGAAYRFGSR